RFYGARISAPLSTRARKKGCPLDFSHRWYFALGAARVYGPQGCLDRHRFSASAERSSDHAPTCEENRRTDSGNYGFSKLSHCSSRGCLPLCKARAPYQRELADAGLFTSQCPRDRRRLGKEGGFDKS